MNNWYTATTNSVEKSKNAMLFRTYVRTYVYPYETNQHLLIELLHKYFGDNIEVDYEANQYRIKVRSKILDSLYYSRIIESVLIEFYTTLHNSIRVAIATNSSYTIPQQHIMQSILEDIISGESDYIKTLYMLTLINTKTNTKPIISVLL